MMNEQLNSRLEYFDGSVFVAGGNAGVHFDVERMRYPTGPDSKPQWMITSLLELISIRPFILVVDSTKNSPSGFVDSEGKYKVLKSTFSVRI